MLTKTAVGAIASSYRKGVVIGPTLYFSQDMEIWSNPGNGGRRSYDGRSTPQYGDTISSAYGPPAGNIPGLDLQFQVTQFFEGNGHKLELYIGNGGWGNGVLAMTLVTAGDTGSGITMTSPWTSIPQSATGYLTVWDTYPGFNGDAHFKQETLSYRYVHL